LSKPTGAEVCAEYVWLVSNGLSVPLACEALGKTITNMERQLVRYGYNEYAPALSREHRLERTLANERQRLSA
jgi:hypothetical protein